MYYNSNRDAKIFSGVDWGTVSIFLLLLLCGWLAIFSAVYTGGEVSIFNMDYQYGMQLVWIGISLSLALFVLLLNSQIFHTPAYVIYGAVMSSLVLVLAVGTTINGSTSWFDIGPFRLQPSEFAKWATGLALARYMSSYSFNIQKMRCVAIAFTIALFPAMLIALQPDMGSAIIYSGFLIMFYREGFTPWLYLIIFLALVLALSSFMIELWALVLIVFIMAVALEALSNKHIVLCLRYVAITMFTWVSVELIQRLLLEDCFAISTTMLIAIVLTTPVVVAYAINVKRLSVLAYSLFFIGSAGFVSSVDYIFNNVVKIHQQKRILDLIGLENDLRGWGYNVHQSKIAIGSGGVIGKGFLQGTQTKYKFVPEQSTDFIFCTIGEEWGFLGSSFVIILFVVLIIRIMRMGDNQREPFTRIYCYYVASIFTMHVIINIGMTIGLVPVIGIPLPFFSYGGSSLLAFTLLLFTAIKLNCRNTSGSSLDRI